MSRLFEPEFFSPDQQAPRGCSEFEGSRGLLAAVLENGLRLAAGDTGGLSSWQTSNQEAFKREAVQEAKDWVSSGEVHPFTFEWICQHLSLDAAWIRKNLDIAVRWVGRDYYRPVGQEARC